MFHAYSKKRKRQETINDQIIHDGQYQIYNDITCDLNSKTNDDKTAKKRSKKSNIQYDKRYQYTCT